MELRFAPRSQKEKQLNAAEKLLSDVDKEKKYPLEFVCFRITEYRPRDAETGKFISGKDLADDLQVFINRLSGQLALAAAKQHEKVYTIAELAGYFSVSTKTIHRWRKRGLISRKFVFDDGKKRLGFLQSAVDEFMRSNADLTDRAANFTRLSSKEKQKIIKQASLFAGHGKLSRHQIITRIACRMKRVPETVRLVLIDHEKNGSGKHIFKKPAGVVGPREAAMIYKMHRQGAGIKELMDKFQRSRSSVHRIINKRRARGLLSRKIDFVDSSEFFQTDAEEKILGSDCDLLSKRKSGTQRSVLLNRDQEIELFRRYNYLKYLVCLWRSKLSRTRILGSRIQQIEDYLKQAEEIKNVIIEANLRLVVSIANKHVDTGANISDLVSEGNLSLMRAVEKFDYTRGYRFSTYASWAIAKDFARTIPVETSRLDKATAVDMSNIQKDLRTAHLADMTAVEDAHRSLDEVIENNLTQREQYIVRSHFGLGERVIKKKHKSLKEIGRTLSLSKERVRQLELIALQKLRHNLSDEEFDLLTR